jgi:hypothetical protein
VRFGRNRPPRPSPHKAMARYLNLSTFPTPPASCDYQGASMASLTQIYANGPDPTFPQAPFGIGDCVWAYQAHQLAIWTGMAGALIVPTTAEVVAAYAGCTGYVIGNEATDQGTDELSAIDYMVKTGLAGHKILGAVAVDATNPAEVAAACWLFGGLSLCLGWRWGSPATGFTLDVTSADVAGGHCIGLSGYAGKTGGQCWGNPVTWGLQDENNLNWITEAALAAYGTEAGGGSLYAELSQDWIGWLGMSVTGFDLEQLLADAAAYGSTIT